ncbi:hypothetical protein N7462_008601 [Penicillium macrosclerotiorum]|uniref:uncharacterized protein n=1 Tax=Penicillium macrosclerotiorum TaxID=303699 RepID=UPI0025480F4B|nr:uncharacterized protein N7462_008601 [Penicillium macrosclerotiorum]KAJ5675704.1 hypothetical protein N7462_008601 [Penicillium macrosclerotiorum]
MATPNPTPTHLAYQHDAKLLTLQTTIYSLQPFASLEPENQALFKTATENDSILVTESTIFHPQGGGQPSDEGHIHLPTSDTPIMTVLAARMDAVHDGVVLHLLRPLSSSAPPSLRPGDAITQVVDAAKRLLYSRLHTAGHVLGSAVNALLKDSIPDFAELKASHFPDSAACQFQGAIEGTWKEAIQGRVDEYVRSGMPVEIEFWDEEDFARAGVTHLVPDRALLAPGQDKFRVVRIVGAEVYPCGGTHVESTDLCGQTTVKKISRSKGVSRVSYTVA